MRCRAPPAIALRLTRKAFLVARTLPIGRASRLDPTRTRADRRKQHDTSLVSSSRSVAGNVGASAALAPPGPAPTPAI